MQILQWLSKMAAEEPQKIVTNSTSITKKQCDKKEDKITHHSGRRKHLKRVEKIKLNCDNLIHFRFFYQTLDLKRLGSFDRSSKSAKKKRSEKRGVSQWADCATLGGNKVLPIADLSQSSSRNENNQLTDSDNKAKTKQKKKAVSRMKELLKWAATAKVLNSRNRAGSNATVNDDDLVDDESPKISLRLEMEEHTVLKAYSTLKDGKIRCSNTWSSTDDLHAAGIGKWITTDSEFVVLEL